MYKMETDIQEKKAKQAAYSRKYYAEHPEYREKKYKKVKEYMRTYYPKKMNELKETKKALEELERKLKALGAEN